jgi:hypothetical protein
MDQDAFRVFFDKCCEAICFEWLPHMTGAQLRTEVLQMMGITWDESDGRKERTAEHVQHYDTRGGVGSSPEDDPRANQIRQARHV